MEGLRSLHQARLVVHHPEVTQDLQTRSRTSGHPAPQSSHVSPSSPSILPLSPQNLDANVFTQVSRPADPIPHACRVLTGTQGTVDHRSPPRQSRGRGGDPSSCGATPVVQASETALADRKITKGPKSFTSARARGYRARASLFVVRAVGVPNEAGAARICVSGIQATLAGTRWKALYSRTSPELAGPRLKCQAVRSATLPAPECDEADGGLCFDVWIAASDVPSLRTLATARATSCMGFCINCQNPGRLIGSTRSGSPSCGAAAQHTAGPE